MIEWLAFVPFDPTQKRHTLTAAESPARPMPSALEFVKNPYDPVMLIDGTDDIPGLFDKGSWVMQYHSYILQRFHNSQPIDIFKIGRSLFFLNLRLRSKLIKTGRKRFAVDMQGCRA
jgi:hypothetical protein